MSEELMKSIAAGIRLQTKCPYCKEKLIAKSKPEIQTLYDEHLKTCKKYAEEVESDKKVFGFLKALEDAGVKRKDMIKFLRPDEAIWKQLKGIMKKYDMTSEELVTFIEQMDEAEAESQEKERGK